MNSPAQMHTTHISIAGMSAGVSMPSRTRIYALTKWLMRKSSSVVPRYSSLLSVWER